MFKTLLLPLIAVSMSSPLVPSRVLVDCSGRPYFFLEDSNHVRYATLQACAALDGTYCEDGVWVQVPGNGIPCPNVWLHFPEDEPGIVKIDPGTLSQCEIIDFDGCALDYSCDPCDSP